MSEEYDFYDWLEDQERDLDEQQRTDEYIDQLLNTIEQLEKALYIACAIIDGNFGACPLGQFDIELSQCENNCEDNSVGCWAEWCMREVQ